MWWGIAFASVVLCFIGRRRWLAARAWEDVQAVQVQITLLTSRLERADKALRDLSDDAGHPRSTAQRDYDQITVQLEETKMLATQLDAIYVARLSPLGARLLSLPAPRN